MSQLFRLKNGTVLLSTEAPGGIYNSSQLKKIAELCSKELAIVKATEDQRLALFVKESEVENVAQQLRAIGLGFRHYQDSLHQPVSCLGELCEEHEQPAMATAMDITKEIAAIQLKAPLKIGVNGCARCCTPCHTLDIAVVGDSTGYRISLGGKTRQMPEFASYFAEGVPPKELPKRLKAVIECYKNLAEEGETLHDVIERCGVAEFVQALAPYSQDAAQREDPFAKTEPMESDEEQSLEDADLNMADVNLDDSDAGLDEIPIVQEDEGSLEDDLDLTGDAAEEMPADDLDMDVEVAVADESLDDVLSEDSFGEVGALVNNSLKAEEEGHKRRDAAGVEISDDSLESTEDSVSEDSLELSDDAVAEDSEDSLDLTEDSVTEDSLELSDDVVSEDSLELSDDTLDLAEDSVTEDSLELSEDMVSEDSLELSDDVASEDSLELADDSLELTEDAVTEDSLELSDDVASEDSLELADDALDLTEDALTEDSLELSDDVASEDSLELADDSLDLIEDSIPEDSLELADDSLELAEDSIPEDSLELSDDSLELAEDSAELGEDSIEIAEDSLDLEEPSMDDDILAAPAPVDEDLEGIPELDEDLAPEELAAPAPVVGKPAAPAASMSEDFGDDDMQTDGPELSDEEESQFEQKLHASIDEESRLIAKADKDTNIGDRQAALSLLENNDEPESLETVDDTDELDLSADLDTSDELELATAQDDGELEVIDEELEPINESMEEFPEPGPRDLAQIKGRQVGQKLQGSSNHQQFKVSAIAFQDEHMRVTFDSGAYVDFDLSALGHGEERSFRLGVQSVSVTSTSEGYILEVDGMRLFHPKSSLPAAS